MREFGHLISKSLRLGLRAYPNPSPGEEQLVECYNLRPSQTNLIGHERIGTIHFPTITLSTLLDDLRIYYKLDETSGTFQDSFGVAHMSQAIPDSEDETLMASVTGIISKAAYTRQRNAAGSAEGARAPYVAALNLNNTSFTINIWCKWSDKAYPALGYPIYRKREIFNANTNYEWGLRWYGNSEGAFGFRFERGNGTNSITDTIDASVDIHEDTWYMVTVTYDLLTTTLYVRVSNATDGFEADSGFSTTVSTMPNGTEPLILANQGHTAEGAINFQYDEFGIWSRVLTLAERQTLWNDGAGITYPFILGI